MLRKFYILPVFGLGKVFFSSLSPHWALVVYQVSRKTLLTDIFSGKAMWNFEISSLWLLLQQTEKCGKGSKRHDIRLISVQHKCTEKYVIHQNRSFFNTVAQRLHWVKVW